MNVAVAYAWLKAVHVAAAIAFAGGTMAQSLVLAAIGSDPPPELVRRFRGAQRWITTSGLLIALVAGVSLALLGNWLPQRWLIVKLAAVVALLGIHGLQSGQLRRLTPGQPIAHRALHHVVLALAILIAGLAVLKPSM